MLNQLALAPALVLLAGPAIADMSAPPEKYDVGNDAMSADEIIAAFKGKQTWEHPRFIAVAVGRAWEACDKAWLERDNRHYPRPSAPGTLSLGCFVPAILRPGTRVPTDPVIVYSVDTPGLAASQHRTYRPELTNRVLRHEIGRFLGWSSGDSNNLSKAEPDVDFGGMDDFPTPTECEPAKHLPIPKIITLPYAKARARLTKAGFQPLLDWERMRAGYGYSGAEEWIDKSGYFEVNACAGTGLGPCLAHFVDKYGNLLKVLTKGDSWEVSYVGFKCGCYDFSDC